MELQNQVDKILEKNKQNLQTGTWTLNRVRSAGNVKKRDLIGLIVAVLSGENWSDCPAGEMDMRNVRKGMTSMYAAFVFIMLKSLKSGFVCKFSCFHFIKHLVY